MCAYIIVHSALTYSVYIALVVHIVVYSVLT